MLELLNTLDLEDFLNQFVPQILPLESAKWFALDCAKFVLPRFEEQYPSDKTVRNCIEVNESFLKGTSTLDDLLKPSDGAFDAATAALDADNYNAYTAACAACYSSDGAYTAAYGALGAAYDATSSAVLKAYYGSKDEMQGFVKNWIDQYFNI